MSSPLKSNSPSPVKSNWRVSHSATITPYQCDFCSKKFGDKVNLDRHVEIWHEDVVKDKEDKDGGKSSSEEEEEEDLFQEVLKTGSTPSIPEKAVPDGFEGCVETEEDPQFSCSQCDQKFYRQANLDVHTLTHRPKPSSKKRRLSSKFSKKKKKKKPEPTEAIKGEFPCQYCSKVYSYFFNCRRHERTCQESPELQNSRENAAVAAESLENAEASNGMRCEFCATSCSSRSIRRHHEKWCSKNPENYKQSFQKVSLPNVIPGKGDRKEPEPANDSSCTTPVNVISCQYCSNQFTCHRSRRRHEASRCPSRPNINSNEDSEALCVNSTQSTSTPNSTKPSSGINCQYCTKNCTSRFALARHLKHQCKKNPDRVKVQNKVTASEGSGNRTLEPKPSDLDAEVSTKIDGGTCKFCAKSFHNSSNRIKHEKVSCLVNPESQISLKTVSDEGIGSIEKAEKDEDLDSSNDSNDSLFKAATGMTCPYCLKDLSTRTNRRRHERTCADNPSSTTTSKNVGINEGAEQTDGVKHRTCQFCSKIFSIASNRKLHERICFGNPSRLDPRDKLCQSEDKSPVSDRPISLSITSSDPFSCKYCSKSYTDRSNRRRHELKCADNPEIRGGSADSESKQHRTCQYCSKIFSLVSYKKLHEKVCSKNSKMSVPSQNKASLSPPPPSPPTSSKTKPCKYCGKEITRNNVWRHEQSCSKNVEKNTERNSGDDSGDRPNLITEESSDSEDCIVPVSRASNSSAVPRKMGPKSRTCTGSSTTSQSSKQKPSKLESLKIKIGPLSFKKNIESKRSQGQKVASRSVSVPANRAGPLSLTLKGSCSTNRPGNPPVLRKGVSLPDSTKPIQLTWKGMQIFFPTVTIEQNLRNKADEALRTRDSRDSVPANFCDDESEKEDDAESNVSIRKNLEPNSGSSSPGPKWKIKASTSLAVSNPSSKLLACKICGIEYSNSSALDRHMYVHLGGNALERKYGPCDRCGAKFTKNNYFTRHMELCRATRSLVSVIENREASDSEEKIPSAGDVKLESIESTIEVAEFEYSQYSVKMEHGSEMTEDIAVSNTVNDKQRTEVEDPTDADFEVDADELNSSHDESEFEAGSDIESSKAVTRVTRSKAEAKSNTIPSKVSSAIIQSSSQSFNATHSATSTASAATPETLTSKNVDEQEQYTHCGVCMIKLADEVAVIKHSKEHTKSESHKPSGSTFECMVCLKKFSTFPHFEQHMYWRHVKVATVFKCEICLQTFSSKNRLAEHSTAHATSNSHVNASSLPSKSNNQEELPANSGPGPCPQNSEKISSSKIKKSPQSVKEMENAANTPKAPTPLLYVCKYKDCQHFFSHDEDLWYHVEKKHKCFNDLCCPQCGQDFQSGDALKSHIKLSHSKELCETDELNLPVREDKAEFPTVDILISNPSKLDGVKNQDSQEGNNDVEVYECTDDNYGTPENDYADDLSAGYDGDLKNAFDGPDIALLVPETTLVVERPNPYVKITPELKTAADSVLQKNPHLVVCRTKKDKKGKYLCDICGNRSFWKRPTYIAHMRYHRQLLRAGVFRDLTKREKLKKISIPLDLTCRFCNRRYETDESYRAHMQYHRTQKKKYGHYWVPGSRRQQGEHIPFQDIYKCNICEDREFTERSLYVRHMKYHRQVQKRTGTPFLGGVKLFREDVPIQDIYKCNICEDREFTERSLYLRHMKYHRQKEQRTGTPFHAPVRSNIPFQDVYKCDVCESREFTDRSNYIKHMKYHDLKGQGTGTQVISRRGPPFREDIPVQDVYKCNICVDREFTNRANFFAHMQYHKQKEERTGTPVLSPFRGKPLREDIPIQDVYKCNICVDREFTNRSNYLSHMTYHKIKKRRTGTPVISSIRGKPYRDDIPIQDVYKCNICADREFTNRSSYLSHMTYHKIKKQRTGKSVINQGGKAYRDDIPFQDEYICELCPGRKFTKRNLYMMHSDYHKKFAPNRSLGGRSKTVRTDVPFQDVYSCDKCDGRTFESRSSYLSHLRYNHEQDQQRLSRTDIPVQDVYQCQYCKDRVFPNRLSYISHYDYHVRTENYRPLLRPPRRKITAADVPLQEEYICGKCNGARKFTDRAKYVLHMNYHDVLERRKLNEEIQKNRGDTVQGVFRCKICPDLKTFTDSNKFRAHIQYHKSKDRSSSQSSSAKDSTVETNGDERFSCLKCGEEKIFTSRQLFMEHLQEHKMMDKLAYKCSLCEKAYASSWTLAEHMKSHDNKKYTCGDCSMRFQYSFSLRRHQENSCKRIQCQVECFCGDKFHTAKELNIHSKREHNSSSSALPNAPWCHVCKTLLPSSSQLNDHVQVCHPEVYTDFIKDKVSKISAEVLASTSNQGFSAGTAASAFVNVNRNRGNYEDMPLAPEVVLEEGEGDIFQPQVVLDEGDGDDPISPQVVLDEDRTGEVEVGPQVIVLDHDDVDVKLKQETNQEEVETPQWQVFKGLEDAGETSDNEDDYDEYPTESFEPEDVEVEGAMSETADPLTNNTSVTLSYLQELEAAKQTVVNSKIREQIQKKHKGPLRYTCAYCDKSTSEPKYMHQHWMWLHKKKGLPYKFVDTATDETICPPHDQIFQGRKKRNRANPASQSNVQDIDSPMDKPTRVLSPNITVVTTVQSQPSGLEKRPTQNILKKPGPKSRTVRVESKQECCCTVTDTALAQLKRCVGIDCTCYTTHKGCSLDCSCATTCNNPYAQRSKPLKSVPGLVPLGVSQTVVELNSDNSSSVEAFSDSTQTSWKGNQSVSRRKSVDAGANSNSSEQTTANSVSNNSSNLRDALSRLIGDSVKKVIPSAGNAAFSTQKHLANQMSTSGLGNNSSLSSNPVPQAPSEPPPTQPNQNSSVTMPAYSQPQAPARFSYTHGQTTHTETIPQYNPAVAPSLYSNPTYPTVSPTVTPYVQPPSAHQSTFHYQPSTLYSQEPASHSTQLSSYTYNPQFYGASQSHHGGSLNNYGGNSAYQSRVYKCAHCNHSASCYSSYIGHQWEHRDKSQFLCPICIVWYNSVPELAEHARAHNNTQSSSTAIAQSPIQQSLSQLPQITPSQDIFHCYAVTCASRFKASEEANRHFLMFHQQLVCTTCKAFLPSENAMKDHQNQHYVCYTCGERFLLYATMQQHMSDAHGIDCTRTSN